MDRPTDIPGVERVFQKGDFKAGVVYYYLQRVADALLYSRNAEAWQLCRALVAWLNPWENDDFKKGWAKLKEKHPVKTGEPIPKGRIHGSMDLIGIYMMGRGLTLQEVEASKYDYEIYNKAVGFALTSSGEDKE